MHSGESFAKILAWPKSNHAAFWLIAIRGFLSQGSHVLEFLRCVVVRGSGGKVELRNRLVMRMKVGYQLDGLIAIVKDVRIVGNDQKSPRIFGGSKIIPDAFAHAWGQSIESSVDQ